MELTRNLNRKRSGATGWYSSPSGGYGRDRRSPSDALDFRALEDDERESLRRRAHWRFQTRI